MIEAVIFDIDGVVVDSDRVQSDSQRQVALAMADELGAELNDESIDWDELVGPGRIIVAKKLFGENTPQEICEDYRKRVIDTTIEIIGPHNLAAIKDINSFIEHLVVRGILLGAATSSNRRIYDKYAEVVDMSRFRTSVTHRECFEDKPKPGPYMEVMRRLEAKPENTLIIEDSPGSINGARYSGAMVLGLATAKRPAETLRENTGAHMAAEDFRHAAYLLDPYLK
jgi:beta-phosphoglucomutase-like phosphatase (HAD superfamily)